MQLGSHIKPESPQVTAFPHRVVKSRLPELLKVQNGPSNMNWTFKMFLQSAVVLTNSKHTFFCWNIQREKK